MRKVIQLQNGFTVIELLLLIVLVSILAGTAFMVLNPVARYTDSKNSKRQDDLSKIVSATQQYMQDNDGSLPSGLSPHMPATQIGTATTGCDESCTVATASACVNLNGDLAKYLNPMPTDPESGTQFETGYYIIVGENSIVKVGSCILEGIEATRVSK